MINLLETHSIFIFILSGTALFLLGISFVSDNLQSFASNTIRDFLVHFTHKPIFSFISGILITFIFQSSGAITSVLVGLGSAGVISLKRVMGVVIGTAVGSSLIVQILTFNIQQWGLSIFCLGFFVYFFSSQQILKKIFAVVMGVGLMYWGLEFVSLSTEAMKDVVFFEQTLSVLKESPLLTVLISCALTILVHSSAMVILFAVSLMSSDLITLYEAVFWIYGANIGTTSTALISSVGSNVVGRQVAWAHLLYKTVSVLIFLSFTGYFVDLFGNIPSRSGHYVAYANMAFNFLSAVLLFPFLSVGVKLIKKIVQPSYKERKIRPKYLYKGNISSPFVALAHAEREVLRMGDTVGDMVRHSINFVMDDDESYEENLHDKDNKVDFLYGAVYNFLADFSKEGRLTDDMTRVLLFASDLESIADVIDKNISRLCRKKHTLKVQFSKEGQSDLFRIHEEICILIQLSLTYFQQPSEKLKIEILDKKKHIRKQEKKARENHLVRFIEGQKETVNTSSIYMDILTEYGRISSLACHHVYPKRKSYDDEESSYEDHENKDPVP